MQIINEDVEALAFDALNQKVVDILQLRYQDGWYYAPYTTKRTHWGYNERELYATLWGYPMSGDVESLGRVIQRWLQEYNWLVIGLSEQFNCENSLGDFMYTFHIRHVETHTCFYTSNPLLKIAMSRAVVKAHTYMQSSEAMTNVIVEEIDV